LSVEDLNLPLPMHLIRRKDNTSPLLARFVDDVQSLRKFGRWLQTA
jgi:hypothetical protein